MRSTLFGGLAAFVLAATGASAITPITIKGNAFYQGDKRVCSWRILKRKWFNRDRIETNSVIFHFN